MSKRVLVLCAAVLFAVALLISAAKKAHADSKPGTPVAAGDAEKGKEVFEQCAGCHNIDTDEKKMGPSLKGLFQHDKLHNGKKPTDTTVRDVIDKGSKTMPAYGDLLSKEEKDNLIAYLHTV